MIKPNSVKSGIPISPSLSPTLQAENFKPRKKSDKKRILRTSLITIIIAIFVSFIAKFLVMLIDLITNLSFYGNFDLSYSAPSSDILGILVIFIPAIGGLIVGLMALYGSEGIRGHGIPEAMEQILTNKSKIKPAITYLKPLSSAIAIGTGGPFGAEGPIIATGGALGSTIGQLLKITDNERKIILAAGAMAGMAAIFGTPVAAIFMAIELLLFEFSPRSIIPVILATVVGTAGHHVLFSSLPVFHMETVAIPSNLAIVVYSAMGIIIGIISVFVSKAVYFIEEAFEKIHVHWMWWPAIGGLIVGIIGYFFPSTMGVGYENITNVLSGTLPLNIILILFVFKFLSWSIALGSGTSGGTLAPLLTIGGAVGALLGTGILYIFPQSGINVPLAALVGMAAMFAGASRALLTSIIFALESTGQSNALLPLLGTCVVAYFISFLMMENTIMTEKMAKRGIKTPDSFEADELNVIKVEQVIHNNNSIIISDENTIGEVKKWLNREEDYKSNFFIISTAEGEYKGILSSSNLFSSHHKQDEAVGTLVKRNNVYIGLQDTLRIAVETMAKENVDVLPVIADDSKDIAGILTYKDILSTYKHSIDTNETKSPNISLKRSSLRMLAKGQKLVTVMKRKEK